MVTQFSFGTAARQALARAGVRDAGVAAIEAAVRLDQQIARLERLRPPTPLQLLRRSTAHQARALKRLHREAKGQRS